MPPDPPAGIPGPLQLGHKAPPTHAARILPPNRSVSAPYSPHDPLSPEFGVVRRSSFSSTPDSSPALNGRARDGKGHTRSKSSTLPSIRSLKNRFQGLGFGSGFGSFGSRKGPKVVKGEEAQRLTSGGVRVSGPVAGGPGLKGFSGPAGSEGGGMTRSASLPASLAAAQMPRFREEPPSVPQLVFTGDNGDEGTKRSVDQALAAYGDRRSMSPYSPVSIAGDQTPGGRPSSRARYRQSASPRPGSPAYGRPIVIPPRGPNSPLPSPFLHITQPPFGSPAEMPLSAPLGTVSPAPSQRHRLSRISQDFARRAEDPPLSQLRKQAAVERDSVTRSLSRQGHRNSRILPGATLPGELSSLALGRSKSAGAADDESKRGRHWSHQLAPPLPHGGMGSVSARSSWQVNGAASSEVVRRLPGILQRRHSVSPVVTPKLDGAEHDTNPSDSPEVTPRVREEHRGRSLSALLGEGRTGLGLDEQPAVPQAAKDERRPSKPFPPEFEEVPMGHVFVHQPSFEAQERPPFHPVRESYNPPPQTKGFPDTPPASARRTSSNPFVPPLVPPTADRTSTSSEYSVATGYSTGATPGPPAAAPPPPAAHYFPSSAAATIPYDQRPPSLYNPFAPETAVMRKQKSSPGTFGSTPPNRISSLPPPVPLLTPEPSEGARRLSDETSDEDRRGGRTPSWRHSERAKSEHYATQISRVLDARERGEVVDIDAVVAESKRELGEDERGEAILRTPDGRSFSQVIDDRNQGKPLDSPLAELIEELKSRQRARDDDHEDEGDSRLEDSPVVGRHAARERSLREVSFNSSPGGEYPFPLASYLDNSSPGQSPSVGGGRSSLRPHARPSYPPPTLSLPAPPPFARSSSSPAAPSFFSSESNQSPIPIPSFSLNSPPPPLEGERSLTLDQMEQEIARMEAELALAGRPQSFYEASPPTPAHDLSGANDCALSTPAKTLDTSTSTLEPPSPSIRSPSPLGVISPAANPPTDLVTPRTARKWSILEIEKAYERMKRLLGSSAASGGSTVSAAPGTRGYAPSEAEESGAEDSASLAGVDVETALDKALEQARGFTGLAVNDDDALEVLETVKDDTLTIAPPADLNDQPSSPRRPSADSFDSAKFASKPLPTLPPPTPSPISEKALEEVEPPRLPTPDTQPAAVEEGEQPPAQREEAAASESAPPAPALFGTVESAEPPEHLETPEEPPDALEEPEAPAELAAPAEFPLVESPAPGAATGEVDVSPPAMAGVPNTRAPASGATEEFGSPDINRPTESEIGQAAPARDVAQDHGDEAAAVQSETATSRAESESVSLNDAAAITSTAPPLDRSTDLQEVDSVHTTTRPSSLSDLPVHEEASANERAILEPDDDKPAVPTETEALTVDDGEGLTPPSTAFEAGDEQPHRAGEVAEPSVLSHDAVTSINEAETALEETPQLASSAGAADEQAVDPAPIEEASASPVAVPVPSSDASSPVDQADASQSSDTPLDSSTGPRKISVDEALANRLDAERGGNDSDMSQPFATSSGRKRKDSDAASSSGGMRRLVLPSANRLRNKSTRDSMLSLASVDDVLSEDSGFEVFTTAEPDHGTFSSPPTSPQRKVIPVGFASAANGHRSPSRLASSVSLRSGVGRELQRRSTHSEAPKAADEQDGRQQPPQVPIGDTPPRVRKMSNFRPIPLNEPISPRDPRRRSIIRTTSSDASTWYPQTPDRSSRNIRSDEQRHSILWGPRSEEGHGPAADEDEERTTSVTADRSLNIANVRNMDKLEVFFKYTAARADMEKAELERDALLDALRETRATLGDVRRQRDALDSELSREKQFIRQVKEHLGGDPERHADRLDALLEGRTVWERRAQEALEELGRAQHELEALRGAMVDFREREELLERENVTNSARLAAAEMALDELAQWSPARSNGSRMSPHARSNGFAASTTSAAPSSYRTASVNSYHDDPFPSGSPTITMSRSGSGSTTRAAAFETDEIAALPDFDIPDRRAAGPKDSLGSTASSSSFGPSSGFGLSFADVAGSPIMGQTIGFVEHGLDEGAKSSFGSSVVTNPSPLKARSSPSGLTGPTMLMTAADDDEHEAALEYVPSQSGYTTFRLPFSNASSGAARSASSRQSYRHDAASPGSSPALSIRPPLHPLHSSSKLGSNTSRSDYGLDADGAADEGDESEYADHSFDSVSSAGVGAPGASGLARLREADEAFLSDLTAEIPRAKSAQLHHYGRATFGDDEEQEEEEDEEELGRAEARRGRRVSMM